MSNAEKCHKIYAENADSAKTRETINRRVPLQLEVIKMEQNDETSKDKMLLVL